MARTSPPRFVVRTTVATLIMVAGVLTAVFVGVAFDVRERVRGAVRDKLDAGQRMLSALEERRAQELSVQVATLAENPTLKAAVDTYQAEIGTANAGFRREMLATVDRELEKLAARISPDVLAVTDPSGVVLAVAGRRKADWPMQTEVRAREDGAGAAYVTMPTGVFQFAASPMSLQETEIGSLQLAKALDGRYAHELAKLSGAATLIASGNAVIASTLPIDLIKELTPPVLRSLPANDIINLGSSEYAVKLLFQDGEAKVYALDSIAASTRIPMFNALRAVLLIAIASFALAAFASVWLARTIARPIDTLSTSLSEMTRSRDFDNPVPPTGFSLEVDTLTTAFNTMMRSVSAAEAETQDAYVGAIRALALALDARDPSTAGHSERVSAVSVAVGRQMKLPDDQLEILRLGALLHDIGKIGISDAVLRKPGAADDRGVRLDRTAPGRRRADPAQRAFPRAAHPDRRAAPRAAGRPGLPAPAARRRDSAAGANRPRRRRVRRDDQRARLPSGARKRRGVARAVALRGLAVRRGGRPRARGGDAGDRDRAERGWPRSGRGRGAAVCGGARIARITHGSHGTRIARITRQHGTRITRITRIRMDMGSRRSLQKPFTAERAEIAEPLLAFLCGLGALRGERLLQPQIRWGLALVAAIALICTSPASAQNLLSDRVSVEFASAITSSSPEPTDPFVVLDATATVRITEHARRDRPPVVPAAAGRRLVEGDVSAAGALSAVDAHPAARRRGHHFLAARDHRARDAARPQPDHRDAVLLLLAAAVVRRPVRSRPAALGRISARRDGQHVRTSMGCARGRDRRHAGAQSQDDVVESPAGRAAVRRRRRRDASRRPASRRRLRVRPLSHADGLGVCRFPRLSRPPRRSSTSRASTRSATRASPASGSWTASKRRRTPPSRAAT